MNAGFLRVAKLNGHHNRVQAGRGRGWGLAGKQEAGRREAWEAITQKNYSHSAWKASLRCLDRLMVWPDDDKDEEDAWLMWWRRRMRAGELGEGGGGAGAERLLVQGNQSNHSLTPAPHNPTSSGLRWKVTFFSSATIFKANAKSLGKQSKVDKVDFLVWHQPFESWLWPRAEGGRSQFPKHFKRLSKTFAPRLKTFLFQSPDFRLIKLVIVLLSDYSQAPNFPLFLATW